MNFSGRRQRLPSRLLRNESIAAYLKCHCSELLEELQSIIEAVTQILDNLRERVTVEVTRQPRVANDVYRSLISENFGIYGAWRVKTPVGIELQHRGFLKNIKNIKNGKHLVPALRTPSGHPLKLPLAANPCADSLS